MWSIDQIGDQSRDQTGHRSDWRGRAIKRPKSKQSANFWSIQSNWDFRLIWKRVMTKEGEEKIETNGLRRKAANWTEKRKKTQTHTYTNRSAFDLLCMYADRKRSQWPQNRTGKGPTSGWKSSEVTRRKRTKSGDRGCSKQSQWKARPESIGCQTNGCLWWFTYRQLWRQCNRSDGLKVNKKKTKIQPQVWESNLETIGMKMIARNWSKAKEGVSIGHKETLL